MDKKWERRWNTLLSMIIIIVLLPLMVTIVYQRMELESVIYGMLPQDSIAEGDADFYSVPSTEYGTEDIGQDTENRIFLEDGCGEEQKVIGIVAKEINANSSKHAILAQSVIARTNYCDAKRAGTPEPEGFTVQEMQELWGEAFDEVYALIEDCARQTEGEVLMYQGNYIYAAYHAVSAGETRIMKELYEETNMPYLTDCQCPKDIHAEGYLGILYWGKGEFLKKCRELFPEAILESADQIVVQKRDSAGYVTEIAVGDKSYTGEEFRSKWELASSCFSVAIVDDNVRIVTKGIGHGLGLSQYSANEMAKEGKDYKEILAYFYPGSSIGKN